METGVKIFLILLAYVFSGAIGLAIGWSSGYNKRRKEDRMDALRNATEIARQYSIGFSQGGTCAIRRMKDLDMISHKQAQKMLNNWKRADGDDTERIPGAGSQDNRDRRQRGHGKPCAIWVDR